MAIGWEPYSDGLYGGAQMLHHQLKGSQENTWVYQVLRMVGGFSLPVTGRQEGNQKQLHGSRTDTGFLVATMPNPAGV